MKEHIQAAYVRSLSEHQAKLLRAAPERRVLIIGSDGMNNIGSVIQRVLLARGFNTFAPARAELPADNWALLDETTRRLDLDTLVLANATTYLDWFEQLPLDRLLATVQDTLTASMVAAHAFLCSRIEQPYRKQIFFIGSMAYRNVLNGSAAYCAAKAGLAHFARCLAWELAPKGVDVFCINPGNVIDTPMAEQTIRDLMRYRQLTRRAAEEYWGALNPSGQWLTAWEIANVVLQLATGGLSRHLIGSMIDLSGGVR